MGTVNWGDVETAYSLYQERSKHAAKGLGWSIGASSAAVCFAMMGAEPAQIVSALTVGVLVGIALAAFYWAWANHSYPLPTSELDSAPAQMIKAVMDAPAPRHPQTFTGIIADTSDTETRSGLPEHLLREINWEELESWLIEQIAAGAKPSFSRATFAEHGVPQRSYSRVDNEERFPDAMVRLGFAVRAGDQYDWAPDGLDKIIQGDLEELWRS